MEVTNTIGKYGKPPYFLQSEELNMEKYLTKKKKNHL